MLQGEFDKTIELLKRNESSFPIAKTLIDLYTKSSLVFSSMLDESSASSRDHILRIYKIRASHEESEERKSDPFVIGYDTLIPNLSTSTHNKICFSDFVLENGTFIIFSDFQKQDLIGILFSKHNLSDYPYKPNFKNGIEIE